MITQTSTAVTREKVGETGARIRTETYAGNSSEGVISGEAVVRAISSSMDGRPPGSHGFGISYAGELPAIAVPQAVELTEFHNRPA